MNEYNKDLCAEQSKQLSDAIKLIDSNIHGVGYIDEVNDLCCLTILAVDQLKILRDAFYLKSQGKGQVMLHEMEVVQAFAENGRWFLTLSCGHTALDKYKKDYKKYPRKKKFCSECWIKDQDIK